MSAIAAADVELLLVGYLKTAFPGSHACTELPSGESPAWTNPSIIQVVRVAGLDTGLSIDEPTVDIDCYADTRMHATDLALHVRRSMRIDLIGYIALGVTVAGTRPIVGPGWRPYANTKIRRVGFTDAITLHNQP